MANGTKSGIIKKIEKRYYELRVAMMNAINSNEQMIQKINEVLQTKKDAVVNIVNDKLTISVFSLLEKNLKNVKEINFVIRDVKFLPHQSEIKSYDDFKQKFGVAEGSDLQIEISNSVDCVVRN